MFINARSRRHSTDNTPKDYNFVSAEALIQTETLWKLQVRDLFLFLRSVFELVSLLADSSRHGEGKSC